MKNCSRHELTTVWTRFNHKPEKYLSHLECKVCGKKLKAVDIIDIFSTMLEEKAEIINERIK